MTKSNTPFARLHGRLVAVLSLLTLTACGGFSTENAKTLVDNASPSLGCESFESDFYDALYKFPQTRSSFPTEAEVRTAFAGKNLSPALSEELTSLYRLLAVDGLRKLGEENASEQDQLSTLAAMEIGDQTSPEKEELQSQIQAEFAKVRTLAAGTTCAKSPNDSGNNGASGTDGTSGGATAPGIDSAAPKAGTLFADWKASRPRVIYGALKTLSTAYQSCDAAQVPALDKNTPDAVGITIVGKHPDGVGNKRLITNINDLLKSHPYLHNYRKPASSCYDITKNMPIYDYGGRPSTSNGSLNFWSNSGSGTAALGTDCSGYVGMSIATSGLRVKKATAMKAVTVSGITSAMFTNPQKNGLTCFDYVPLTKTAGMRAGDIIAKAGHVVIVESVGADPWGIANIKSASECTLANMSIARMDFTILQDSPEKGGIGIQRSKAADYFPSEAVMPDGLLEAAVTACKAKFGVSGTAKNDKISVVRHSGSSDCMNASEIAMDNESCVASCPSQSTTQQLTSN